MSYRDPLDGFARRRLNRGYICVVDCALDEYEPLVTVATPVEVREASVIGLGGIFISIFATPMAALIIPPRTPPRLPNQLRAMTLKYELLDRTDGSARFGFGTFLLLFIFSYWNKRPIKHRRNTSFSIDLGAYRGSSCE